MIRPTALRISLFYAALMAPVGIQLPYIPIWFQDRGVTPVEIGVIGFCSILARFVTGPLVGSWVDRRGDARAASLLLGWLAVFAFLPHLPAYGIWALLAAHVAYTVVRAPTGPLGDTLALAAMLREGLDFGRMRLWGSVSFLAIAVAAGPAIDRIGSDAVAWLLLLCLVVSAVGAHLLPAAPPVAPRERPRAPVSELLRRPVVLLFLAASSLVHASHAVVYAYAPLGWRDAGLSQTEIGLLWAVSTISEILLMALGDRAIRRVAPGWLLLIAALVALPRWALTGIADSFWALAALQLLHAATFGFAYLGAVHWIAGRLPATHAASAQTLNGSAVTLAIGVAMLGSGPLFADDPSAAYLAMAGLGGLGAIAAAAMLWRETRSAPR